MGTKDEINVPIALSAFRGVWTVVGVNFRYIGVVVGGGDETTPPHHRVIV